MGDVLMLQHYFYAAVLQTILSYFTLIFSISFSGVSTRIHKPHDEVSPILRYTSVLTALPTKLFILDPVTVLVAKQGIGICS